MPKSDSETRAGRPGKPPSRIERILFGRPALYRIKRFFIERVLWDGLLGGILRLDPRPLPASLADLGGCSVLLAACGPGHATTGPRVDDAERVTAFDLSRRFAATCARERPGWQVFCGDLLRIPSPDDAFDVAVLYSSLHHVSADASRVLKELARVSRRRVVLLEGLVPERGALRRLLLLWYRLVDGGHHYYTLGELEQAIREAGLRISRESSHGPIRHMWLAELECGAARSASTASTG